MANLRKVIDAFRDDPQSGTEALAQATEYLWAAIQTLTDDIQYFPDNEDLVKSVQKSIQTEIMGNRYGDGHYIPSIDDLRRLLDD